MTTKRSLAIQDAMNAVDDEMRTVGRVAQKTPASVLYREVLRLEQMQRDADALVKATLSFLRVHNEFCGGPLEDHARAVGEYIERLEATIKPFEEDTTTEVGNGD